MPNLQVTDATAQQMSYILLTFRLLQDGKDLWRWTFLINPDTYIQTEPVRANVIQTIGGAYVDAFGRGLATIRISGVSGWRLRAVTNAGVTDGWQHWQGFLEKIYRYFLDKTNEDDKHTYELRFYNWMDKEYYAVYFIDNLRWQRQAPQDSLWRRYDFTLICLYPVPPPDKPEDYQIIGQTVINRDDPVLAKVYDVKSNLLDIENNLWTRIAIIKQLVGLNNPAYLDSGDQAAVKAHGYYGRIEPSEELTEQNFPGIYQYTGRFGEAEHPQGSALSLVDNALVPLAWAIDQYRIGKTDKINVNYGAVQFWKEKLVKLANTLSTVYNPPPKYLIRELLLAACTLGKFAGHQDMFASSGVGLS
ncbi:MAG: hypothetical protein ACPL5F_04905 [Moorellaceae bacterium]